MRNAMASCALLVCGAVFASNVSAQEENYITFGLHGGLDISDSGGSVKTIGYERAFNGFVGMSVRALTFEYDYDDGFETEDGDGTGIEAGIMLYPGDSDRFFFGAGLGYADTDWVNREGAIITVGSDESLEVWARLGYRFNFARMSLTPQVQVGDWGNTGEEFGTYAVVGVELGIKF